MPLKTRFVSPPSLPCPLRRRHLLQEAVNHPQDTASSRLRNSRAPQPPSRSPLPPSVPESRGTRPYTQSLTPLSQILTRSPSLALKERDTQRREENGGGGD